MKTILQTVAAFILPVTLYAATDCRFIELTDRYEAICVGDERYAPEVSADSQPIKPNAQQQVVGTAEMVRAPLTGGGASSLTSSERPRTQTAAVKKLIDYRQHRLQRSEVEAKKVVRMQMIQAGRRNETAAPQPQNIDDM